MKIAINFILLPLVLLSSCLSIYFEHPQPIDKENLGSFPKELIGSYLADEDTIYILEKEFQYPEIYQGEFPLSQLDSIENIYIEGNLLHDKSIEYNEGIPFTVENDTLSYYLKIYLSKALSDSLLLRKMKDMFILNEKAMNMDQWSIYLLKTDTSNIIQVYGTGDFQTKEDSSEVKKDGKLETFFPITEFKKMGENEYLINPTYEELDRLITAGFFKKIMEMKSIRDDN